MKIVRFAHRFRIFIEERAVGLQMNDTARLEETAVALQEHRTRETAVFALHLRVRKSQPYLRNLARREKCFDKFNAGAQESDIRQSGFGRIFGSLPESCALDIHTDIVHVRIPLRERSRVLPLSAAKFQHNGTIPSVKHFFVPMSFHRVVLEIQRRPKFSRLPVKHFT